MAAFFYLLRTEMVLFARSRVALFWTLAFPLLLLILQMTLFGSGQLGSAHLVIVDPVGSSRSEAYSSFLRDRFMAQHSLQVNTEILRTVPIKPTYDAIVTLPDNFDTQVAAGASARVTYIVRNEEGPVGSTILGLLRGLTDSYDLALGQAKPAVMLSRDAMAPPREALGYSLYLVTGLAVMIMLSTSLMGFAVPLVSAREGGLYRLYQMFPIHPATVLVVWWLARLMIVVLASLIMIAVAAVLYGLPMTNSITELGFALVLLVAGAGTFLSGGILLSSYSPNVASATMLCNLIYFPLLFTGNLMLPTGGLPAPIQATLSYLPVNATVASLRHALSGHIDWRFDLTAASILIGCSILGLLAAQRRFRWVPQH